MSNKEIENLPLCLLAAAPAMLKALVDLSTEAEIYKQSHAADCDCEFCLSLNRADAAIRLAKGESQ